MQWLDDLWGSVFGSGSSGNSTDITDYNRAADTGPGDVGIRQVGTGGAGSPGSSSISRDATGGSALTNSNWSWRDLASGLAAAGQAAGADNRYLPPGLAIGAFGSGLVGGMDKAQEDRIKLDMAQRLQSAQAQNLLASGKLSEAQAGMVPDQAAYVRMQTTYQDLVNKGYDKELAARIAGTYAQAGLATAQASAVPSQIALNAAEAARSQALANGQSAVDANNAAEAAFKRSQAMAQMAQLKRDEDWRRERLGLPPLDSGGSTVSDFGNRLTTSESSGNPNAQTPVVKGGTGGYSGLHQFGAPRLQDLGYYTMGPGDKGPDGKWNGAWTGTFQNVPVGEGQSPVKTIQDFMGNTNAQNAVFTHHVNDIDNRIRADGLDKYVGATLPDGTPVTVDGMRAAAHLGGYQGMKNYLVTGTDSSDRLGTKVSDYFRKFATGGGGGAAAQAAPAASVTTPAQRAIMGGGGAPGGGFGGLGGTAPAAAPAAPSMPAPGGGFGARVGAPLTPAQSVLSGGGDVLGGMPQPVPGSPGAPAVFAGPGAPPAPLNPQQAVLSSGGFGGPGLEGGGGPVPPNLGGSVPAAPAVAPPAPQAVPQPAGVGSGLGLNSTINQMPPAIRASLANMTAAEGTKYVAEWVRNQIGREITLPAAEAEKMGIPGTSGFNPGTVLAITPKLGGGMPEIKITQAGLPPMQPFEQEEKLANSFKNDPEIKDFPKSKTHLDTMNNLYNKFLTNPSGATGAAMVIELGKMIDPAQVVRQTEANKIESNSVSPRVTELYNRFNYSGASISPEQARDLLDNAYVLHSGRIETVADAADAMRERARSWGVNPNNVVNPKLFPPDLKAKALEEMEKNKPAPFDPSKAPAILQPPPAKPPVEPPKSKYTADWANSFEKPTDFGAALGTMPVPDLLSIPAAEIEKMTQQQKNMVNRAIRARTVTMTGL